MQQSDYILREIEKISLLLKALLGKMVSNTTELSQLEDTYLEFVEKLETTSNVDLDEILSCDKKDFQNLLSRNAGFDNENIELLADILVEISRYTDETSARRNKFKALEIYNWLNEVTKVYSIERMNKISNIN